jgi:tRNA (mo5U34)-methyltransferase
MSRMTKEEILLGLGRLEPWFHCIDLGEGIRTKTRSAIGEPVEHPEPTWRKVRGALPDNLSGKSVLDVGCNAGFYSIEMKRCGAARVLGVDSQRDLIRQAQFVRRVLGVDVEYERLSVYDLDPIQMGQFDVTLALGLIYHCKHPVLALERLFAITREWLVIETAVYPPEKAPESFEYDEGGSRPTLHPLAYIENTTDAKEAIYNWFVPSVNALTALLKNVGFDSVEIFPGVQADRVIAACHKREPYPDSRAVNYLAARLTLSSALATSRAGEVLAFRIGAENVGYARWLKGQSASEDAAVHLVAHVLDKDEEPVSWYHAGAFLPHDVAPGEAVEIDIEVRAPAQPGNYILMFDMVSEHLAWFEDLGSQTVMQAIEVI